MGQMSQRRDLDDIGMISDFATLCGDEENLRELYLLTFCDLASVAPDAMSSWKETLLGELYTRTLKFLRRGPDLLGAERAEIVERRQKRAAAILRGAGEEPARSTTLFGGFPDRYFAENSALRIAKHVRLIRERARRREERAGRGLARARAWGSPRWCWRRATSPASWPRWRACSTPTGSRSSTPPSTRASRPTTREEAEALDVFRVRDGMRRPVMDEGRWKKVREDLEAVLSGKVKGEALVAARPRGDSIAAWRTPAVPTELKLDNDVSRDFTVIEVITEDRPGVLYAITRTLFNEGLDIHRSKIATEANRAIDVFYVRDKANLVKITDPERMMRLKTQASATC